MSDMESIDRRLDALENENRALRSKIVQLESGGLRSRAAAKAEIVDHAAAPVSRLDASVTITTPPPVSTFKIPSPSELTKLLEAVGKHFPALLSTDGPAFAGTPAERRGQFDAQFVASFEAIGNMKRTERPRTDVYMSYHVESAETVLKSFGRPSMTIRGTAFLAAALAHFDVAVSGINRQHEGIVPEIGLHQYTGRPATDAWRKILAGEAPREVGVQRRPAPPSPARVTYY